MKHVYLIISLRRFIELCEMLTAKINHIKQKHMFHGDRIAATECGFQKRHQNSITRLWNVNFDESKLHWSRVRSCLDHYLSFCIFAHFCWIAIILYLFFRCILHFVFYHGFIITVNHVLNLMEAEEVLDGGRCVEDITFSRHRQHEAVQSLKQGKTLFGASGWLVGLIVILYKHLT